MNTRVLKSLRDLKQNRSRTALLVAAVAVGVGAAGGVLGAFNVIDREIESNFASTSPADAVVTIAGDARLWVDVAEQVPGVLAAEPRAEVVARVAGQPGWQPVVVVVIDDFESLTLSTFTLEPGAVAPGAGQVLIERASLTEFDVAVGDTVSLSAPGEAPQAVSVVGLAHDPGRTPAWMDGTVIAYATPETMVHLGYPDALPTLLIESDGATQAENLAVADSVAASLESQGVTVLSTRAPMPGEHPARGVMTTLLTLLQSFGVITLFAGVALVVTLIATQMTQQRREIALMKTSGATSGQIAGIYLTSALFISTAGLVFGVPLGLLLTRGLSSFAFTLLNLEPASYLPAPWIVLVQVAIALFAPAAAIAFPVWRRSRVPVRAGLEGVVPRASRQRRSSRVASRWGRAVDLGVRNAVRDRARLVLNAIALGVGVAAFISALNTGAAWDRAVDQEMAAQHFDVEVVLDQPTPAAEVAAALAGSTSVSSIEMWSMTRSSATDVDTPGALPGASFRLYVPPVDAQAVSYPILEGRWLEPGDDHALVISQNLDDPSVSVGSRVRLDGDAETWTVVGRVMQLAGDRDGVAYASERPDFMTGSELVNAIRIDGTSPSAAQAEAEEAFGSAGIPVTVMIASDDAKESLDDHLLIITGLLLAMAVLLAIVGTLGLVESIGTAALARRREIGVAQAVGASSRQTIAMVVGEAVTLAVVAWAGGAIMSWPLSAGLQAAVGNIFAGAPLPFTMWVPGLAISAVTMLLVAAVTSAVPALEAADRPVRESLAHE